MTTYLEQAAERVREVGLLTSRLAERAAELRGTHLTAAADAIEAEVDRRNMWLADRLLALAAIERNLPPGCQCGHQAAGTEGSS